MSNEQVKEEQQAIAMTVASRGSTVGIDLERPNLEEPKKTAQFLPSYGLERGAFVSLATQDFLQPLERGSRESSGKVSASSVNGDVPLQLSSREDPIGKESYSTRMQLPNLRMQYGYVEHPHAHVSKPAIEASQQPVMNRHWQQNPVSSGTKRPRSVQSEGDDTDVEERRKVHRDDASSRSIGSIDLKSTSRSKHSATEQRRRSKINDRFQMLRELLPQGDQKRDKASFLLEVIEYIQVLQDKVKKFESLEKVRQQERLKQAAWDMNASTSLKESSAQETAKPRSPFAPQENRSVQVSNPVSVPSPNQVAVQAAAPVRPRPLPEARVVEDLTKEDTPKAVATAIPVDNTAAAARQGEESSSSPKEPVKNGQEELPIKQGVISISSAYSQGLLQALTNALQSSGLDLSKANISVQIELGKPSETTNKASQQ